MTRRARWGVLWGLLLPLARMAAQPVVPLGAPQAVYAAEFAEIAGVRELSTGALIVVDRRELKIWRLTGPSGTPASLGRSGHGPGEYQAPVHLAALPGDSTLVTDAFGDGRVLLITRDGMAKDALAVGRLRGRTLVTEMDVATDATGNLYERARVVRQQNGRAVRTDSDAVRRVQRQRGTVDTIGRYFALVRSPLFAPRGATDTDANSVAVPGGAPPPFASRDRWAVAPDGRLAFVSVEPYQIRFRAPAGTMTEGPVIPVAPLSVTAAVKAAWRTAAAAPVLTLTVVGKGQQAVGFRKPRVVEPAQWPKVLPPFSFDAVVQFAPDGRLWIERTVAPGSPPRFDIIDATGRVERQVLLPKRSRLVGFGPRSLYVARLDDDDVERLERFARP